jgi:hypothetical protein
MFWFMIGQSGMINPSLDGIIINILTGYSGNIELIAITAIAETMFNCTKISFHNHL